MVRKKTKLEFKRLDGTVKTTGNIIHYLLQLIWRVESSPEVVTCTDANGVKQSLTQKCSDLDKHVPELLGVTSAVMENVVFCHQEGMSNLERRCIHPLLFFSFWCIVM